MNQFLARFIAGGLLIAILPIVARKASPTLAGVVAMIPAVTLFGFIFVGLEQGSLAVKDAAVGALAGLGAVLAFLATVVLISTSGRGWTQALVLGLVSWLGVAGAIAYMMKGTIQ